MKRVLIISTAAALIMSGAAIRISAQTPPSRPTKQQFAQKVLDSPAAAHMTSPARKVLDMIAHGDSNFSREEGPRGTSPSIHGAPIKGGPRPANPGQGNVRVNDPGEDSHQPEQTTQSETTIAVAGNNIAVGFNDSQSFIQPFLTGDSNLSGVAYSRNGGNTFIDGGTIPNAPAQQNLGDPWLASDASGTMYYSTLAVDVNNLGVIVGVAKSTDGGQNWSAPTTLPVPAMQNSDFFLGADKDALTAAPGASGNLIDGWDDVVANFDPNTGKQVVFSGLTVARTTDGGAHWSSVYADRVPLFSFDPNSGPDCSYHQYIGAQPIVGSDGTVYVAALRFDANDPTCTGNVPVTESEVMAVSHNGGASFAPPVTIATVASATQNFGAFQLGPGQIVRDAEFPSLAFFGNSLYAAWNDGGAGDGNSHVRLARSSNGGATWSTSWVTSTNGNQLQPEMSATASGLHILYYQINGDKTLDVYDARSSDGVSFSSQRISSESFPGVLTVPQFDPVIAWGYMGDYIANVSDGTHVYFAWGDNRDVVTSFMSPNGRHDPNVFFAKQ